MNAPAAEPQLIDPAWSAGTVNLDRREQHVAASPTELFQVVCSIGGRRGWYTGNWLWSLRGVLDSFIGGVGMRRGRLHRSDCRPVIRSTSGPSNPSSRTT